MPAEQGVVSWTKRESSLAVRRPHPAATGIVYHLSLIHISDISESMAAQRVLAEHNRVIIRQNQELHFLNNETPGGYHCCENDRGLTFMYISNRFLEILGWSAEQIRARFDNKMMNMIHPGDRERVRAAAGRLEKGAVLS